jgi:GR25 family glycosyltransferase involved in LPS biosynthesis
MDAFIINLKQRTDRWDDCMKQKALLNANLIRVEAISSMSSHVEMEEFAAPGVAATWKSHQKAMKEFLGTEQSFALILEDDFVVRKKLSEEIYVFMERKNYDFLQLGYLTPHYLDFIAVKIWNLQDLVLKIFAKIHKNKFFGKHLIYEQQGIPYSIVLNDIRAGGHAYIISRRFAEACQQMNNPVFLSTDGMFMALGVSRNFKTGRLRRSMFKQSNSPSSVLKRFNLVI